MISCHEVVDGAFGMRVHDDPLMDMSMLNFRARGNGLGY